jgi:hypothetical protein
MRGACQGSVPDIGLFFAVLKAKIEKCAVAVEGSPTALPSFLY